MAAVDGLVSGAHCACEAWRVVGADGVGVPSRVTSRNEPHAPVRTMPAPGTAALVRRFDGPAGAASRRRPRQPECEAVSGAGLPAPLGTLRKFVVIQRGWLHLYAEAGGSRDDIATAPRRDRVQEMLVQMVREFGHSTLEGAAHADVVNQRHVLGVLTETETTRVRTDRNLEFRRQQKDRQRFAESAQAAVVELAEIDRTGLHQLLEDDAVGGMFAGRNTDWMNCAANGGMSEDIVGAGGLLDPQRMELRERAHQCDSLADIPRLVCIHHHKRVATNLLAHQRCATHVLIGVAPYFDLETRPTRRARLTA